MLCDFEDIEWIQQSILRGVQSMRSNSKVRLTAAI